MAGDFGEKMDELITMMADGESLTGSVEVNQVYAHYQHEGLMFKHPLGGRAKYLESPLYEHADRMFNKVSGSLLHDGGIEGMSDAMEDLAHDVHENAPREFMDLRDSAHPKVEEGSKVVYDRAPVVSRLTTEQLKAKDRLRDLGWGPHGWGGTHHPYGRHK